MDDLIKLLNVIKKMPNVVIETYEDHDGSVHVSVYDNECVLFSIVVGGKVFLWS